MKKIFILALIIIIMSAGAVLFVVKKNKNIALKENNDLVQSSSQKNSNDKVDNNDIKYPILIDDQMAMKIDVVVNKKHRLSEIFQPSDLVDISNGKLRQEAADSLNKMLNNKEVKLKVISAYRSYDKQKQVYEGFVKSYGQMEADKFSARPGHSEHQTGLAVDVGALSNKCNLEICFGDSDEGKWLKSNAQNYGYIIRYPLNRETSTGYTYEPWHLRYVGIELAKKLVLDNLTLDEYFGVPAGGY